MRLSPSRRRRAGRGSAARAAAVVLGPSTVELLEQRRLLADFGDAPDTYRTTLNVNGARHDVSPNLLLGARVDDEPDGQPSPGADRDDINSPAGDDEDGVVFTSPLVPGAPASVQVTNGAATGFLNAWLDFNINGGFDAGEQIFTNQALPGGSVNNLSFTVPAGATPGASYARFRLGGTVVAAPVPFGPGGIGEVEDYAIRIDQGVGGDLDFGDAPDTFGTTLAVNGARHTAVPQAIRLGNRVDGEPDGQPSPGADKDDANGVDDEDGVTFLTPLQQGAAATVQVVNGANASRLNAWVDFNGDGVFGAGEQVFTNVPLPATSVNNLNFNVPAAAALGQTYARFRVNTGGGVGPTGFGDIGEVEDYTPRIELGPAPTFDYGDAPDSYRTTLGVNGARHFATPNLRLGPAVDAEPDGQPSPNADKDDLTGVPDDEDGVVFLTPLVQGQFATVQVSNGGAAGRLNAWMDFNGDGTFGPGEQIFTNVAMAAASVNVLAFVVPPTAAVGQTYSRFRLNASGGLTPFGFGGTGEVEDYLNRVDAGQPAKLDYGDAPNSYRTTFGVNGARHSASPNLRLGALVDAEPDGQPTANATGDDANGVDDEDGVNFLSPLNVGAVVTVAVTNGGAASRLNAWFDFNADGTFGPGEQIFTNAPLAAASVTNLNFVIPAGSATGITYSRWRINAAGGLGPAGFGGFGEVEDYENRVAQAQQHLDFGDAPEVAGGPFQYPTLLGGISGNPARHTIAPNGPRLGPAIDFEVDGQPNLAATGDDTANLDDEDGVTVGGVPLNLTPLVIGSTTALQITNAGAPGLLNAWFDWNQNGSWSAAEQVATNLPVPAGVTILNVSVPAGLNPNTFVYSRFRLSTVAGLLPTGLAANGEVEDYRTILRAPPPPPVDLLDFGDAPDGVGTPFAYPTSFAGVSGDPARHRIVTAGPRLGNRIDPEPDGQPNVGATGDDAGILFGGIDDEDGVFVGGAPLSAVPLVPGGVTVLQIVNGSGLPGLLNAWFDWNADGTWTAAEQVALDVPVPPGSIVLPVAVPAGLSPNREIYSRFRLSTQAGLSPRGFAHDGEVEDYVNRVIVDTVGPIAGGGVLEFETRQAVHVFFSEPIDPASVDVADLMAFNTDTNQMVMAESLEITHEGFVAAWIFNSPGVIAPDGDYRFLLPAVSVMDEAGNTMLGDFELGGPDTFWFGGDANRNRTVEIGDFALLAANFNRPGTFSHGNFDYTGNTDIADFAILAAKFNTTLPGSTPARSGVASAPGWEPDGSAAGRRSPIAVRPPSPFANLALDEDAHRLERQIDLIL